MNGYTAHFSGGPDGVQDMPVVTHDVDGYAMVYCLQGYLIRAASRPDFQGVRPAHPLLTVRTLDKFEWISYRTGEK